MIGNPGDKAEFEKYLETEKGKKPLDSAFVEKMKKEMATAARGDYTIIRGPDPRIKNPADRPVAKSKHEILEGSIEQLKQDISELNRIKGVVETYLKENRNSVIEDVSLLNLETIDPERIVSAEAGGLIATIKKLDKYALNPKTQLRDLPRAIHTKITALEKLLEEKQKSL